jgi:hypothetical protein
MMKSKVKKENDWSITIIGSLLLAVIICVQTVDASSMGSGDSFDTATQIEPGNYEDEITQATDKYFYTIVKAGQELVYKITLDEFERGGRFYIDIFDEERSKITEMSLFRDETKSFSYSTSSKKDSYRFYIKIKPNPDRKDESFNAKYHTKVAIGDHFDANSGTDAGDTFIDALSVSPGNYEGFLSVNEKSGNDLKDYYKLSIQSGDKVNIALTPSSEEAKLILSLFNEDRETVKTDEPKEAGAIARTMWLADSSQDIFILVKGENKYYNNGGGYSLDITTGKAPLSEQGTKSESKKQPGFESFLALLCLTAVHIGHRMKRRVNRKNEKLL